MEKRPSWDKYFMNLAEQVSTRGTCDRKQVGAVLVLDKRVIATGYNGSISGQPHCSDPEVFFKCTRCGEQYDTDWKLDHCFKMYCRGSLIEKHGGHDMEDGHCIRTIHAEINALADAAKRGVSVDGATLYCNTLPCWPCFKALMSAGITRIVYRDPYRQKLKDRIFTVVNTTEKLRLERWSEDE
jgi:dCMP deaminase